MLRTIMPLYPERHTCMRIPLWPRSEPALTQKGTAAGAHRAALLIFHISGNGGLILGENH